MIGKPLEQLPRRVPAAVELENTLAVREAARVHVFERAGLGKAPFRFIRVERRVGPLDMGNGCFVGAPGQPMGTCQYCGEGIAECCVIRSADGREFVVGNVCVGKTGDAGLRKVVAAAVREHRREAQARRDNAKIDAARERVQDPKVRAHLASFPHPYADRAAKGMTKVKVSNEAFLEAYVALRIAHYSHDGAVSIILDGARAIVEVEK